MRVSVHDPDWGVQKHPCENRPNIVNRKVEKYSVFLQYIKLDREPAKTQIWQTLSSANSHQKQTTEESDTVS